MIQALTPHVNAQSQPLPPPNASPPAPIPGAPPSSHDPPGASPMPLPMPPPSTPSACHLAFYKLLENMHNLWERSVLAKWVLHESNLHCNQAFNKLLFNALQFMFWVSHLYKGGARSPFSKYLHYCDFEDIVYQKTMDSILLPRYQCTGQTHHWQMLPSPGGGKYDDNFKWKVEKKNQDSLRRCKISLIN